MCWIWKLWVQSTMIYLSPIYAMLHLIGHTTLIQLRGFTCYRIKYLRIMFFESRNSHTGPLLKVSKICNSFEKTVLENCIFIRKSLKGLLPFIFKNWFKFFLSHTLKIRDGQILVILKYPLTLLSTMVDIRWLLIQYIFEITYIVAMKMLYFIRWEQINWKDINYFFPK